MELARIGVDNIPVVTLVTIGLNVVNYLVDPLEMSLGEVCVGFYQVVQYAQVYRLLLSAFYHAHDLHLYYNMSSLVLKGRTLEPIIGSWKFAWMMIIFAIGSSALHVALQYVLATYFSYHEALYSCGVGFSAVLFGLKVVVNDLHRNGHGMIMGFIPVEMRYLVWAELLLIHILMPNSSFWGHLCGILMGLAYKYHMLDPIFVVVDALGAVVSPPPQLQHQQPHYQYYQQPNQHYSPNTGRRRVVNGGLY